MKIDAVGVDAYLESSKIKPTSTKEISSPEKELEIKGVPQSKIASDKVELSYGQSDLMELLSIEEKEFLEKLFGYEQKIRSLNKDLKVYTKQDNQDKKILGTKIDLIA